MQLAFDIVAGVFVIGFVVAFWGARPKDDRGRWG